MAENNQLPVIYTMRFRFKRTETLRFLSHLDQQTTFQRAFRRAGIPLVYSGGFHPHPKMAFAQAMSVGMTSDCEYGDVQLTKKMTPEAFIAEFNQNMPTGLEITAARLFEGKLPSLTASVVRADYIVTVEYEDDIMQDALVQAIDAFLNQPEILIQKRNKKGKLKEKNIKPFVLHFSGAFSDNDKIIFELSNAFINQATVKPVQVIAAFEVFSGMKFSEANSWRIHRNYLALSNNENLK